MGAPAVTTARPERPVEQADEAVKDRELGEILGGDGEDGTDQDLLDMLRALWGPIDKEKGCRRGHHVDDADEGLL
jgi:hypothetical protein